VSVAVGAPATVRGFLGNSSAATDKDDYALSMPAGTTLSVARAAHPQGTPYTTDGSLRLLDASGAGLAQEFNGGAPVSYTPLVGRQVYVEYSNRSDLTHAYQLTFTLTASGFNPSAPTVSPLPDQWINEDGTTGPFSFTVGDDTTAAANLAV